MRLAHLGGDQGGVLLAPLGQQLADPAQQVESLDEGRGRPSSGRSDDLVKNLATTSSACAPGSASTPRSVAGFTVTTY